MTSPVSHGYPDYGRFMAGADKLLASDTQVGVNASTIYPRLFVGDVDYVSVFLRSLINHFAFTLRFLDANVGGNLLSQQVCSVRNATEFDATIPTAGPFLELEATPSGAGSSFQRSFATAHSPHIGMRSGYNDPILISFNQVIGAGANATFNALRVYAGEAHWFTESAADDWTSRLETFDYAGASIIIDEFHTNIVTDKGRQVFVPPVNMRIVVTNFTVGAASFRGSLVHRPIEVGR